MLIKHFRRIKELLKVKVVPPHVICFAQENEIIFGRSALDTGKTQRELREKK